MKLRRVNVCARKSEQIAGTASAARATLTRGQNPTQLLVVGETWPQTVNHVERNDVAKDLNIKIKSAYSSAGLGFDNRFVLVRSLFNYTTPQVRGLIPLDPWSARDGVH